MTRTGAVALAAVTGLAVVGGLIATGGPGTARLERLDERRMAELRVMARAIETWTEAGNPLPETADGLPERQVGLDPVTSEPYGYEKLGDRQFRVCAELALPGRLAAPEPLMSRADVELDGDRGCISRALD